MLQIKGNNGKQLEWQKKIEIEMNFELKIFSFEYEFIQFCISMVYDSMPIDRTQYHKHEKELSKIST